MFFKKIIFIGFQKTGTSMFRDIFRYNGFTAAHGRIAGLCGNNSEIILNTVNNHIICSDWCEDHVSIDILKKIKNKHPDALFILNTRPIWDWIESRFKHYDWWLNIKNRKPQLLQNSYFDPTEISEKNADIFIQQRNNFYSQCLEIFKNSKNFLILDITQPNIIQYLSDIIGFNLQYENRLYNKRTLSEITKDGKSKILDVKQKMFNKYGESLMSSPLTFHNYKNQHLLNFKNNIKDKYCFIVVIEDKKVFWTQLKLLLFSFRKNSQKYKNSKFWVLVNDGEVEQSKIKYLQNQFRPLEIVQKKSEINFDFKNEHYKTYRKYNAFIHFDQVDQFDRIIYLDSDFIFAGDFVELLESDTADFSAHSSHLIATPADHMEFIKNFLQYSDAEIYRVQQQWLNKIKCAYPNWRTWTPKMPNFNSGFLNMNENAFMCIKNNIKNYLSKIYSINGINFKNQKQNIGNYEQIALSLIAIHEIKNYSISSIHFRGPSCFHMFKLIYGNAHYGGTIASKHIPNSVLNIISEFEKCNYIQ